MRPQSDDFPIHVERAVEATLEAGGESFAAIAAECGPATPERLGTDPKMEDVA